MLDMSGNPIYLLSGYSDLRRGSNGFVSFITNIMEMDVATDEYSRALKAPVQYKGNQVSSSRKSIYTVIDKHSGIAKMGWHQPSETKRSRSKRPLL